MQLLKDTTLDWLAALLGENFEYEKHHYSHQDDVYKIRTSTAVYYLKIAKDLQAEHDNIEKTGRHLLTPEIIGFKKLEALDHLLMTEIPGKNLAEQAGTREAAAIVKEFAFAVRRFHSLDIREFFPDTIQSNTVVLHGDMSLPNIISTPEGGLGYIDLAQMSAGTPDIDLADAIWSLQRNLGPGYGELFLSEYGLVTRTAKIEEALNFKYSP